MSPMLRREPPGEAAGYALYDALVSLAAVPGGVVAALGAAVSPRWRHGIRERAGALPDVSRLPASGPRLWIHAASIGEVRAAQPLLAALRARRPDIGLYLTAMTPEGQRTGVSLGHADAVAMLPLDAWGAPGRVMDAVEPDALVLLETELWPGLLRAARRRLIPVLVVNGRISARSFGRYHAARAMLAPVLDDVAAFAMQAPIDRQRILALGADPRRVSVHGNLKFDALSLPSARPPDVLAPLANEVVWVAGSTHEGEETAVADAYLALRASMPALRLIVAPRHRQRAEDARRALAGRGLEVVRRSELTAPPPRGAVVLLDTAGELAGVYALATAVFVGGSLIPRGGHNPLEPLAHGRPVAFGPHTHNFPDVTEAVLETSGARRVADAAGLADAMRDWLSDPAAARSAGAKAREAILERHGAVARALTLLERWTGPASDGRARAASWMDLDRRPTTRFAARVAGRAYRVAVAARRALYDHRVLPAVRAGVPVISLGGVVAGGTGKTPAAIWLARLLAAQGRRVAVVSRGYGARPGPAPLVVARGGWNAADPHAAPTPGAAQAGDEPLVIAAHAPDAAVVVHPDRVAAANVAESLGADVIVLDDGFQHRRLSRVLDVVLLDAASPFGNNRYLPAGPLRDLPSRLADAGLVLLTRADTAGESACARAAARVSLATAAPIARFAHTLARFERVFPAGRAALDAPALDVKRPYAFAGIADPAAFFLSLRAAGVYPVGMRGFADHRAFTPDEIADLERDARAAGAEALLTTEKDAVRFSSTTLPLYVAVLDFVPRTPADEAVAVSVLSRALATRSSSSTT